MQTNPSKSQHDTVDQLNSFLRGELSAVETYQQALTKLVSFPHRATLEECATSHQRRVTLLAEEVRRRGGKPAESSGAWGTFAKAVEGSSAALGPKLAIAALEEGEDHGRNDYDRDVNELDADARQLVAQRLMPEQVRTHASMSKLKKLLD
jgi:demethoxyubiquinone hydroxylase (CLK1/Coq7/Cat5 family)